VGRDGRATAVVRDAVWYPLGLPRGAAAPTCSTRRRSGAAPLVRAARRDGARPRGAAAPELFNRWNATYSRLTVPRVVRAARRLIAISEFTKAELVELLGVDPAR
jgi:hypothetical protein